MVEISINIGKKEENEKLLQLIGNNFKKYRLQSGFTQESLAEKVGISTTFYANIERGGRGMSIFTLKKLSEALEISADYLLGESNTDIRLKNIELMLADKPEKFITMVEKTIRAMSECI